MVAALLDSALGAAVVSAIPAEAWCATTSLSIQFLSGGTGRLVARGRVQRRGSRVAFAAGEVVDARERTVATASGTWHVWPSRPGGPGAAPPPGTVTLADTGQHLRVGKILAVGRNYAAHRAEMGVAPEGPPVLFFKPPSALFAPAPDRPLPLPTDAGEVHHEVELVAVVGRRGRDVPVERALDHVRGYAVGIDLTLRDLQSAAKKAGEPWCLSKGFDGSAPIGEVVPREGVGDGSGLAIALSVNGEIRQSGNTGAMLRGVAELVAFASRRITLEPGDLIFTGTPAGVGPLAPGDRVEATIERVGTLVLDVVAEER